VLHLCDDPLHSQQSNPTRQIFDRPGNRSNPSDGQPGSEVFPYVVTTYRLTEHHTAGGMSRGLPYLAELQPEFFCEVSPELARERGLEHGGWATIVSVRTAIEARVLVTSRMPALRLGDRVVHQIGLPYHRTSRRARRRPAISGRPKASRAGPARAGRVLPGPGRHRNREPWRADRPMTGSRGRPDAAGTDGIDRPIRFTRVCLTARFGGFRLARLSARGRSEGGCSSREPTGSRPASGAAGRCPLTMSRRIAGTAATPQAMDHKGAG
jgi:hypothetical protein